MNLSERQRLMLREMGVRLWSAPSRAVAPPAAEGDAAGADSAAAGGVAAEPAPRRAHMRGAAAATPSPVPSPQAAIALALAPVPVPGITDDARAAAIAAADWPALREMVAACEACSLCRTRRQTVFGVGHPQAHWMIVGEAPGEQEDAQGEPFVGAAGQLLDNMLRALQLTREAAPPQRQVYIANTLKCRPPRNRNPEPEELARCEPFLLRQIELIRPRIILAMGRFAVQSLLRSAEPVGKLRGRVHRCQGVPLVVTYHPAYLLRNPADKARAWDDLCLAAQIAEAAASPAAPA